MKKAMLAPLCSALVIPGLGQVINEHIKKGVILLAAVFVLIVVSTYEMYQMISDILSSGALANDTTTIMAKVLSGDYTLLGSLLAVFTLLWLYSVIDAFIGGRKADELERGDVT